MTHLKSEEFWAYISGEMSSEKLPNIDLHIKSCMQCRTEYNSNLELHKELHSLDHEAPSTDFSKGVMSMIESNVRVDKSVSFWIIFSKMTIVFSFIIAFSLLLYYFAIHAENISTDLQMLLNNSVKLIVLCIISWGLFGIDRLLSSGNKETLSIKIVKY